MNTQERRLWQFAHEYDPTLTELPEAFQFGDSPKMADELLELVLSGKKTATTGWPPQPHIQAGMLYIVLDGAGEPKAIIRTTRVEHMPFLEVPAEFAAAEGEGDLTLEWWRNAHRDFYTRQQEDPPFSGDAVVQCETFELVWPAPAKAATP